MGLFGVNMPLLYGEGNGAFLRLPEQILARTNNESIFAWTKPESEAAKHQGTRDVCPLLAGSPQHFRESGNIQRFAQPQLGRFQLVSGSLQLTAEAVRFTHGEFWHPFSMSIAGYVILLELHCFEGAGPQEPAQTCLIAMEEYTLDRFRRVFPYTLGRDQWDILSRPGKIPSHIQRLPSRTYCVPWMYESADDMLKYQTPPAPSYICGINELLSSTEEQLSDSDEWCEIDFRDAGL